jgi:hypothetical protein
MGVKKSSNKLRNNNVGAELCVCPGSGKARLIVAGADTQVCPYVESRCCICLSKAIKSPETHKSHLMSVAQAAVVT